MYPFPQVKRFCSDSYCNKVQIMGEWECSLKTPSRDVNVVMILRYRLFFPPYYMPDGFGEQTKTVTLKQSLTAWSST